MFKRIPISLLNVGDGVVLCSPIYDSQGTKLVGSGVKLTAKLVERLKERGIEVIVVDERDAAKLRGDENGANHGDISHSAPSSVDPPAEALQFKRSAPKSDAQPTIDRATHQQATREGSFQAKRPRTAGAHRPKTPFRHRVRRHGAAPYDPNTVLRFEEATRRQRGELLSFRDALLAGEPADVAKIETISTTVLEHVAEDIDLSVNLAVKGASHDCPVRQSLDVSSLAISIGVTMELDETSLSDLGIGCLVHDFGMCKIDDSVCQHTCSSMDLAEIADHPVITARLFQQEQDQLPDTSLQVVLQMHERLNGSGYPQGQSADDIHQLARIAAVADVFRALVMPSRHRKPILPYKAMETLLYGVKSGLFASDVVRAMLDTVSLFPIGSFVELNNRQAAQVIRARPGNYHGPVVRTSDGFLDISSEADLEIVRPLAPMGT